MDKCEKLSRLENLVKVMANTALSSENKIYEELDVISDVENKLVNDLFSAYNRSSIEKEKAFIRTLFETKARDTMYVTQVLDSILLESMKKVLYGEDGVSELIRSRLVRSIVEDGD